MDTALSNGDFDAGTNGIPRLLEGAEELFQRAAIRLTVPLGSFACDPELGSRLYTLPSLSGGQSQKALAFAQEALRQLPQLTVVDAEYQQQDPPQAVITVQCGGETKKIEVSLKRTVTTTSSPE